MDNSTNLNLPYIAQGQAQKHITHNEAIRNLDAIVQLSVLDRDLTSPPVAPNEGGMMWLHYSGQKSYRSLK